MNASSNLKWIGREGNACRKQYPGVLAECIFLAKGSLDVRELPTGCKADVASSYTVPFSLCRKKHAAVGEAFWRGVRVLAEKCCIWLSWVWYIAPWGLFELMCMRRALTDITCAHGLKWWCSCNQPHTLWNRPILLLFLFSPSPPDHCTVVSSLI